MGKLYRELNKEDIISNSLKETLFSQEYLPKIMWFFEDNLGISILFHLLHNNLEYLNGAWDYIRKTHMYYVEDTDKTLLPYAE